MRAERPFRLWAYDDAGREPADYVASFETLDSAIVGRDRHAAEHPGRTIRVWEWQKLELDGLPPMHRYVDPLSEPRGERVSISS